MILDAADEALHRLGWRQGNRSVPSLQSSSSSRSSFSIDTIELGEPIGAMDDAMMDSFLSLGGDDDLDLSLDVYHAHLTDTTAIRTEDSPRRPSFRRNLSLTSLSLIREPRTSFDKAPSLSGRSSQRSVPTSHGLQRPSSLSRTSYPVFDPSASHYTDPEAKLKLHQLRVYLGSAHKFDEAIKFGFPSLETQNRPSSRRPSIPGRTQIIVPSIQTFYDDDNMSLCMDHDEVDAVSPPDPESPDTPLEPSFHLQHLRPGSRSTPANAGGAQVWRAVSDPYAHSQLGNREMTLRMTLTRPDLRADDSVLYPKGEDPLALRDLPPLTDGVNPWAKGPKEGGRVKKLWRRISQKN